MMHTPIQRKASTPVDSHLESAPVSRKAFTDNRPEAIAQRKLQSGIQASAQLQQAKQLHAAANGLATPATDAPQHDKGLPAQLKSGIESLSGMDMGDVRVHRNSDKPAQLQAHAYAQGNDIHLGPGQEQHLPHEAWHVVQQREGRVQPTKQLKGKVAVNDDAGLEREADVMGAKAMQMRGDEGAAQLKAGKAGAMGGPVQMAREKRVKEEFKKEIVLQTNFVSLKIKKVTPENGDLPYFIVTSVQATNRPPTFLDGEKMETQGQHKVAWIAISEGLKRCEGFTLEEAQEKVNEIADLSQITMEQEMASISVVDNQACPDEAKKLIRKCHDYLVTKQKNDPSWEAKGSEEEKKAQLSGKGEKALKSALEEFREMTPENTSKESLQKFLTKNQGMQKLFDTTGRKNDEVKDVLRRAKIELRVHNPKICDAWGDVIDDWVNTKGMLTDEIIEEDNLLF